MAVNTLEFWGSNHYNNPPLTPEMLAQAERRMGVTLPLEFVSLLKIQNGGYTLGFIHPMQQRSSWAADHVPLRDLAGICPDEGNTSPHNLLRSAYLTQEWGLPARQVVISGDGPYWLTQDYRKSASPSVRWIDVDCNEDIEVAPSFARFVAGLVASPDLP